MPSLRALLITALSLTTSVLAQDELQATARQKDPTRQQFHELLNAIPEDSLHAALHMHHPRFQDGIYERDRSAVEAVHSADPPLATRLLAVAALDLIKRQNSSVPTTTPTSPPPSTSVIVPITISTTNSAGSTIVQTTSAVASASVSVAVPITLTQGGSTVVTTSSVPGAVIVSNGKTTTAPASIYTPAPAPSGTKGVDVTTTDSSGATVVLSHVNSGQVISTTDARGSTFVTTYTPAGGEVSALILSTTTLPDGSRSTITSFAVVPHPTGSAGASGTGRPALQNAAPVARNKEAAALVGAAIGVAILI